MTGTLFFEHMWIQLNTRDCFSTGNSIAIYPLHASGLVNSGCTPLCCYTPSDRFMVCGLLCGLRCLEILSPMLLPIATAKTRTSGRLECSGSMQDSKPDRPSDLPKNYSSRPFRQPAMPDAHKQDEERGVTLSCLICVKSHQDASCTCHH